MSDMTTPPQQSEPMSPQQALQALTVHITELRKRIMWCFAAMLAGTGICYYFKEPIYGFLVKPLANAMEDAGGTQRLIYTGLTEAFFTYLSVSFFAGCFLTFPIILIQIWRFVAPGLYQNERKVFLPYLVATPVLFFLGGALVYYMVIPMAWHFFLSFQSSGAETVLPVQLEASVKQYLDLIMMLIFAFGLCFQLPVLLTLMARAGLTTAAALRSFRKYAIVAIFTVAAIITPPDVISQLSLAFPICALYELSIFLVARIEKARDAQTA